MLKIEVFSNRLNLFLKKKNLINVVLIFVKLIISNKLDINIVCNISRKIICICNLCNYG